MDTEKNAFPREVLQQPKEERFAYFKNKVIGHDRLLEVDDEILQAIHYPSGISLILVYGPTGVGKSTLRMRLGQKLLAMERDAMVRDPGYLPVAWMDALAASRSYDLREHFARALSGAREPLIDYKTDYSSQMAHKQEQVKHAERSELALRRSFVSCAHHRRMKVFIVDEAQHLNRIGSGKLLIDQMNTIKSVAEETGAIHVLIGTYDLLGLTGFGCVGVLKTLLNDALSKALRLDAETITEEILKECAPPLRDLIEMSSEIAEGERALAETDEQLAKLKTFVNTPPSSTKKKSATKGKEKVETHATSPALEKQNESGETAAPKPKYRRKPGERKPNRDRIGRRKNAS